MLCSEDLLCNHRQGTVRGAEMVHEFVAAARRTLHQEPELMFEEVKTSAYIRQVLPPILTVQAGCRIALGVEHI